VGWHPQNRYVSAAKWLLATASAVTRGCGERRVWFGSQISNFRSASGDACNQRKIALSVGIQSMSSEMIIGNDSG
jgi:hypothetical protein